MLGGVAKKEYTIRGRFDDEIFFRKKEFFFSLLNFRFFPESSPEVDNEPRIYIRIAGFHSEQKKRVALLKKCRFQKTKNVKTQKKKLYKFFRHRKNDLYKATLHVQPYFFIRRVKEKNSKQTPDEICRRPIKKKTTNKAKDVP